MVEELDERSAFDSTDRSEATPDEGTDARPLGLAVVAALSGIIGVLEVGAGLWWAWSGFTGVGGETLAALGIGVWGVVHVAVGALCLRSSRDVWQFEQRGRKTLLKLGTGYIAFLVVGMLLTAPGTSTPIRGILGAVFLGWCAIVIYLQGSETLFLPAYRR